MRQILFRGKRKQEGMWCHGDFVRFQDGDRQVLCIYGYGEVYPESIGQFTGVYDKNGDEIYEGDILEFDGAEIPEEERAVVIYADGRFKLKNPHYDYMDDLDGVTAKLQIIVGNIHDNPELLEDKQ